MRREVEMIDVKGKMKCDTCGRVIEEGAEYWALNLHREALNGFTISVHAAEFYAMYCCESCAEAGGVLIPYWMTKGATGHSLTLIAN